MIYAEKYQEILKRIDDEVEAARQVTAGGDLWHAMTHLDHAFDAVEEARQLLLDVSKTALERVMKEKPRG